MGARTATTQRGAKCFLAERYVGRCSASSLRSQIQRLHVASKQLAAEGERVRLLSTTFVPGDEVCFWLVEAHSISSVELLGHRAAVNFERIAEAMALEITPAI